MEIDCLRTEPQPLVLLLLLLQEVLIAQASMLG